MSEREAYLAVHTFWAEEPDTLFPEEHQKTLLDSDNPLKVLDALHTLIHNGLVLGDNSLIEAAEEQLEGFKPSKVGPVQAVKATLLKTQIPIYRSIASGEAVVASEFAESTRNTLQQVFVLQDSMGDEVQTRQQRIVTRSILGECFVAELISQAGFTVIPAFTWQDNAYTAPEQRNVSHDLIVLSEKATKPKVQVKMSFNHPRANFQGSEDEWSSLSPEWQRAYYEGLYSEDIAVISIADDLNIPGTLLRSFTRRLLNHETIEKDQVLLNCLETVTEKIW